VISKQNKKVDLFLSYCFYLLLFKTSYLIATIISGLKIRLFQKFLLDYLVFKQSYKEKGVENSKWNKNGEKYKNISNNASLLSTSGQK
jgi:hypothetical protein